MLRWTLSRKDYSRKTEIDKFRSDFMSDGIFTYKNIIKLDVSVSDPSSMKMN